ncbi:MAG: hypothetical protein KDI27_06690 [Gammaproteobacteria bacterium]|nr:hypothetical protein [Gammaproteobacteria bacterium]MCP5416234.1 hypothetical protein [Chromatiaceae bacterium]
MALKETLESRESDCTSAQDYAALASEALTDPVDKEYARYLLDQGETAAQMPPDYVAVAEVALGLDEPDYAMGIYEQAEEMCFDALEFAAVGRSLAANTTQKEKAKELLQRAAETASKPEEYLVISGFAGNDLKDDALAAELLSKVDANAKSLTDYTKLVKSLIDAGDAVSAKRFFRKAERYLNGIGDTLNYAEQIKQLFDDQDGARSILEEAESSCQFPKDFAQLASGFKRILGDEAQVKNLMQQAADFAMTGEEQLDLGNGYWDLLQDKAAALEAFQKALPDLNDKAALLTLGTKIAKQIGDAELAKKIFTKVEQKSSGTVELRKLAQTVLEATDDRSYAADIYLRASETMDQPNDLISLAGDLAKQLDEKAKATEVYRKAFSKLNDFGQYLKLLEQVENNTADKGFGREILARAAEQASGTPDLLQVCKQVMAILNDTEMCRPLLQSAEAQVTSVGEMKNVLQAVGEHFPEDSEWLALAQEKLALREANQAKYATFQKREISADNFIKLMQLTDDVMAELNDVHYARKLLDSAEKMMNEQGFELNRATTLVKAVATHLKDNDWSKKLLASMAKQCRSFASVRSVAQSAIQYLPAEGKALAATYYQQWEEQLKAADDTSGYDWTKLAAAVHQDTADVAVAGRLLQSAGEAGGDRFFWAHLGDLAGRLGDSDQAKAFFGKALAACTNPLQVRQVIGRLLTTSADADGIRELYAHVRERFAEPRQQLVWAEGILELFDDHNWAKREFDGLTGKLTSQVDREIFETSRRLKFGDRLRGHGH